MIADGLTCRELVELVTEYLEGTLASTDRARFESHLDTCSGCRRYVEQMRLTIRATGALSEEKISPEARDALLEAFRGWRRGSQPLRTGD
jgi:anti-sigma factor RsiW